MSDDTHERIDAILAEMQKYVGKYDPTSTEDINVSLVQLIAVPENFHGRVIRVMGFLTLHFEGQVLYLHREDYECGIARNGIWVDIPSDDTYRQTLKLHLNYVLMEGTFSSKHRGHMNMCSGCIHTITRLEAWPVRSIRSAQERQG